MASVVILPILGLLLCAIAAEAEAGYISTCSYGAVQGPCTVIQVPPTACVLGLYDEYRLTVGPETVRVEYCL